MGGLPAARDPCNHSSCCGDTAGDQWALVTMRSAQREEQKKYPKAHDSQDNQKAFRMGTCPCGQRHTILRAAALVGRPLPAGLRLLATCQGSRAQSEIKNQICCAWKCTSESRFNIKDGNWGWWHTSIISVLWRLRQEDC